MAISSAIASTWSSRGKPVATWVYQARPPAPEPGAKHVLEDPVQRARWLGATVGSVLRAVARAKLERAEVVTESRGEDAFAVDASEVGAVDRLVGYLTHCPDFVAMRAELSLVMRAPGGGALPLPFCLTLTAEGATDDESHALLFSRAHPFELCMTVNTTLFVEATFDGSGDNRAWARTNHPLLEEVLQAAATVSGVSLVSWDAEGLSDQQRSNGFANLAEEYRISHLGHTANDLHYVERKNDGVEVVEISHFEISNAELRVRYRLLHKLSPTVAAVLILEHFVPEVVTRANLRIETIQVEELDSKRINRFQWPPGVSGSSS